MTPASQVGLPPGPVLVVVAHPDDEVLGCGATLARLAISDVPASVCFMAGDAAARTRRPTSEDLRADTETALGLLGVRSCFSGGFPNIRMNTIPHIELVEFVESAIRAVEPRTIITHHPGDLNDDHRATAHATLAACRLGQRNDNLKAVDLVLMCEILSATDWSFPQIQGGISANYFVEVGPPGVEAKLSALAKYRGVMRPYPHPRSQEAVRALAVLRGAAAGLNMAEAFEVAFATAR